MGAGGNGLVAVDTTRADNADRGLCRFHHAGLHGTGVAAQDDVLCYVVGICFNEEGVLHVARRMVCGEVHLREYVHVILHLGAVGQCEAHA